MEERETRQNSLIVDGESDFLQEYFPELTLAPWHRVSKMLPDRRISPEGRFCLSQTTVNAKVVQRFPSIWSSTPNSKTRQLHPQNTTVPSIWSSKPCRSCSVAATHNAKS